MSHHPFWNITETEGLPTTEGPKLYVYRPGNTPRVALWWRGEFRDDGDRGISLCTPYCWANLDDIPKPPP